MPKCDFCSTPTTTYILPPDFIDEPIEFGDDKGKRKCHFCMIGSNVITTKDGTV